jgi:hypothetical protein
VDKKVILKIKRFVPVFVLLFLTVFTTAALSINHAVGTAWKEQRSGLKLDVHSGVVPADGDPVPGGGVPDGTNQTNGNC